MATNPLLFEPLEDRLLFSATPGVTMGVPPQEFISETFDFSLTFDNTGTDPGFGPFLDLRAPFGIDVDTPPTYLGTPVNVAETIDNSGGAAPITFEHPYTKQLITVQPGEEYYVFELPFGSVVPAQPNTTISLSGLIDKSEGATVGVPLTLASEAGFRFGETPVNDPATDPPLVSGPQTAQITPTVWEVSKQVLAPEKETATGPNFPRTWQITIDVANGETITDADIIDLLPDNVQYLPGSLAVSSGFTLNDEPTAGMPGGTLDLTIPTITGTLSGSDVVITYQAFVPEFDAGSNPVLPPDTGASNTSTNGVDATALYDPGSGDVTISDTVGSPQQLPNQDTLTDRSIALQKSSTILTDTGAPGLSPGDTLEYTLQIQVSDFFQFQDVTLGDLLSDGQTFLDTSAPTLSFRENGVTTNGNFTQAVNYTFTANPDGTTDLTFDISNAMVALGGDAFLTGDLFDTDLIQTSGTIATITYRATVDTAYQPPTANSPSIGSGDSVGNDATITATVRQADTTPGGIVTDGSSSATTAPDPTLDKSIYAINGSTTATGAFGPGDTVTFELSASIPGNIDQLTLQDFVPLPKFEVAELNTTPVLIGASNPATATPPTVPGQIVVVFDSDHFQTTNGANPDFIDPAVVVDGPSNSFSINFGDLQPAINENSLIRVFFTLTATDAPVADGLLLTNQLIGSNQNSQGVTTSETVAIEQVVVEDPELSFYKGVAGFEDTGFTFGDVTFQAPNLGNNVSGLLNDTSEAQAIDASDLLANEIDGQDTVRFAVVLENTGRTDAFNVVFQDQIPLGFVFPAAPASLNLTVRDGAGNAVPFTITAYDIGSRTFTIELTDTGQGAINQGKLGAVGTPVTDGSNFVYLTYDLVAESTIDAGASFINTATLTNYTGTESSTINRVPNGLDSIAEVTTQLPIIAKTLLGTELDEINNNAATEAVIGEKATYEIVVTVPEGSLRDAIISDQLDPGLTYISGSAMLTLNGVTASLTPIEAGQTINFNLGTVLNPQDSNAVPETLTITYETRVANILSNRHGTQLGNDATLTWVTDNQTTQPLASTPIAPQPTITVSNNDLVVIEPLISIDKLTTDAAGNPVNINGNVDAGDTIFYTITYTADGNRPTAYDTTFYDQLPIDFTNAVVTTVIDSANLLTPADFIISGGNLLSYPLLSAVDMAPNRTISLTVQGTLSDTVSANQFIENEASINWTSLNGSSPFERTGADGQGPDNQVLNNYQTSDDASFHVRNVQVAKALVTTSEAHTSGSDVTIGEIVRYQIEVTVPEGVTPDLQIRDLLPDGLTFLNDGTATYRGEGSLESSTLGPLPAGATTLGDNEISRSPTANDDNFQTGTDVFFKLGDITNNSRDNSNDEKIIIEFNAILDNTVKGSNDAGDVRENRGRVISEGVNLRTSGSVDIQVVEPNITIDKSLTTPSSGIAQDEPVEYVLTISNPPTTDGATAFDVNITDQLPAELKNAPLTFVFSRVPDFDNSAGLLLDVTYAEIAPNETITITIMAETITGIADGLTVINTSDITYTSLPGLGTPAGSNPTGSQAGTPGGDTGERTGSGTPAINDYTATDDAIFQTGESFFVKLYQNGTLSEDDSSSPFSQGADLQIGESMIFDIVVVAFDGTSNNLVVSDLLPEGLRLDPLSPTQDFAVLTQASDAPYILQDFNGTINLNPTVTGATIGDPSAEGPVTINFEFGNVTTGTPGTFTDNVFAIRVRATAINDIFNQDGVRLDNNAQLDTDALLVPLSTPTNIVPVFIVEPDLTITKTVLDPDNLEAGDSVFYDIVIQHSPTSTAAAFDLRFFDILPGEFEDDPVISASVDGALLPLANFQITGTTIDTIGDIDLLLGQTITITVAGTLKDSVTVNQVISNTAHVTWTSMDGDSTAEPDQRTGPLPPAFAITAPDDYYANASADITIAGTLDVDKFVILPFDGTATIGEQVFYGVEVTLAEGTTNNLVLIDTLDPGMAYDGSFTPILINDDGFEQLTPVTITDLGTNVEFDFGTVVLPGNNDSGASGGLDTGSFTLIYATTIQNLATVNNGNLLTNTVDGNATGLPPAQDDANVTVVEPLLTIDKSTTATNIEAGDTVIYTITVAHDLDGLGEDSTSTAFDLDLTDTLPASLINPTVISAAINGNDVSSFFTFVGQNLITTPDFIDLGLTESLVLVISGQATSAVRPGEMIDNTAQVTWTSLNGSRPGERTGPVPGPNPPNDYIATSPTATITVPGFVDIEKTALDPTVAIGQTADYRLAVTVIEGTTENITITDTLPSGTRYIPGSAMVVDANGTTITNFQANLVGGELVITIDSVEAPGLVDSGSTNVIDTATFTLGYQVIVENLDANQAGVALDNTVEIGIPGVGTTTDDAQVIVVEPLLDIFKFTSNINIEAGDTVSYQVVVVHDATSTSDAFDLVLSDTLPAQFIPGSAQVVAATIDGTSVAGSFFFVGNQLFTVPGPIDLAIGQTLLLTISARVINDVSPLDTIDNTIDVTWTSTNGVNPDERDGSGVPARNDYNTSANANQIIVPGALDVEKTILNPANNIVTIGDTIDYRVDVSLIEGITENVTLVDQLPEGVEYIAGSFFVADTGGGLLAPEVVTYNAVTRQLTATFATVQFFGITDSGSRPVIDTGTFTVGYQAVVLNEAENSALSLLPNVVTGSATNTPTDQDVALAIIGEPILDIVKTTTATNIEAGDTVTYVITVDHSVFSTFNAYDLELTDLFPDTLFNPRVVAADIDGRDVTTAFTFSGQQLGTTAGAIDLLLDQTLTLTISGVVVDTISPADRINNTVDLTYTSTDGINPNERDYAGTAVAPTIVIPGAMVIEKEVVGQDFAPIGGILNYQLDVSVIEGVTENIVIVDQLASGTAYMEGTARLVDSGGIALTPLSTNYDAAANRITFTFASAAAPGRTDSGATDAIDLATFSLGYQVRVLNAPANVDGSALTNIVTASATNTPTDTADAVGTVIEPQLTITKTVDVEQARLGQEVTYTLTLFHRPNSTSNAFDVILTDLVPSEFENVTIVRIESTDGVAGIRNLSDGNNLRIEADEIPLGDGIRITFTATVALAARPGATLENNARIYWDSIGDQDGNEIFDPASVSPIDRDYGAIPGYIEASIPNPNDPAQDTVGLRLGDLAIGDTVWQDINQDGKQNLGEPGIAGVRVWVDIDNDGVFDANEPSAITDSNGNYLIEGLTAGVYTVRVDPTTLPDGLTEVFLYDDPFIIGPPLLGSNATVVTLGDASNFNIDFGYDLPNSDSGNYYIEIFIPSTREFDRFLIDNEEEEEPFLFTSGFPLFSGAADPGSRLFIAFFNGSGELIFSNTVMADSGGNWAVSFPDQQLEGPVRVMTLVLPNNFTPFNTDDTFNFRTNYATGVGGISTGRFLSVEEVFSELPTERMNSLMLSEQEVLNVGDWEKQSYEFLAAPAVPGS